MEVTKKLQKLSLAALIVSLLPLLTLVPVFLKITLPDGVRMVWAICNIVLALAGLLLSVICVKSEESRSIVNIMSTLVSVVLVLMMLGIAVLALVLNVLQ
jgi:biotin transporter BioY